MLSRWDAYAPGGSDAAVGGKDEPSHYRAEFACMFSLGQLGSSVRWTSARVRGCCGHVAANSCRRAKYVRHACVRCSAVCSQEVSQPCAVRDVCGTAARSLGADPRWFWSGDTLLIGPVLFGFSAYQYSIALKRLYSPCKKIS